MKLSAVQLLKLRARFLWRVSFKLLLGRRFGLQNGRKLPRILLFGTTQLYISRPNACFTSAANKANVSLSQNALSFTAWLRLV